MEFYPFNLQNIRDYLLFFSDKLVGNIFVRYIVSLVVIIIVMVSATINLVSKQTSKQISLFVYLFIYRKVAVQLTAWISRRH